ncbi:adhesion/invasion protein (internalin), partial [Lactobacillus casei]|nr:adhesion/invasion protein (internalin) [Lacticaseibacillus casei]
MKKTIAKKVLTLTSTILMTLLMVLGFNGTRVQADTNDTTTQNVVLTKYGF